MKKILLHQKQYLLSKQEDSLMLPAHCLSALTKNILIYA